MNLAFPLTRDRDRKQRQTVRKIGGSVERIDDPAWLVASAAVVAAFFGEDAVVGKATAQLGADDFFRRAIVTGDQIGGRGLAFSRMATKSTLGEHFSRRVGRRERRIQTVKDKACIHGRRNPRPGCSGRGSPSANDGVEEKPNQQDEQCTDGRRDHFLVF